MPFLPLHSVTLPHPNRPTAADSIAPELRQRQASCTACSAEQATPPAPPAPEGEASPIVEVEFKGRRKALCRNPHNLLLRLGDLVLLTTPHGTDAGHVSALGSIAQRKQQLFYNGADPELTLLRKATDADRAQYEQNRRDEPYALQEARHLAKSFPEVAQMKLTDAEWQWDRRRLTFYFTAPTRVDFRQYVRALSQRFRTRIELRQIHPRDETRRLGGIGPCGRELCCATFLRTNLSVPLSAVRTQMLPLNLTRLSGLCGRLKCCLLYELDLYREALQHFPPLTAILHTDAGPAKIVKIDIFHDTVQAQVEETGALLTFSRAQLSELQAQGRIEIPSSAPSTAPDGAEDSDDSLPTDEELP